MRSNRGRRIGFALAGSLLLAACASSKGAAPGGSGAAMRADPSDTTSGAYGGRRADRARGAKGSRISRQDIERAGNANLATFIESRLAGVRVIENRGDYVVRIAGSDGNATALVLIDGTEGSLAGLSLKDVEAIEVLKDSAAAVYGLRGAHGVLMVTTRKQ